MGDPTDTPLHPIPETEGATISIPIPISCCTTRPWTMERKENKRTSEKGLFVLNWRFPGNSHAVRPESV